MLGCTWLFYHDKFGNTYICTSLRYSSMSSYSSGKLIHPPISVRNKLMMSCHLKRHFVYNRWTALGRDSRFFNASTKHVSLIKLQLRESTQCLNKLINYKNKEEIYKITDAVIDLYFLDASGWPSGLRRCVQVAVRFSGRGFESHFWQTFFFLLKYYESIHN